MFKFEELEVYKKARLFTRYIYKLTEKWPKGEIYGLTDQFRRAAVSINLNIAEGSSRTQKDFGHFLDIAKGSVYECVAISDIAKDNGYFESKDYEEIYRQSEILAKMLSGLVKYLRS